VGLVGKGREGLVQGVGTRPAALGPAGTAPESVVDLGDVVPHPTVLDGQGGECALDVAEPVEAGDAAGLQFGADPGIETARTDEVGAVGVVGAHDGAPGGRAAATAPGSTRAGANPRPDHDLEV
jgi:hypothetical protein